MYSIVRALKDFTVYCQTTHEPTAEGGMTKMIGLLSITLEPAKPLVMLSVPAVVEGEEEADPDLETPATPTPEKRPHSQLTALARKTRVEINSALARRFLTRYGPGLHTRSHLFDRALLLSPSMFSLKYLDVFAASTAGKACAMRPVPEVRKRIHGELVGLITEAVIELRARDAAAATTANGGDGHQPGAKRAKTSHMSAADKQSHLEMVELGLADADSSGEEGEQPAAQLGDPKEEAEAILKEWLATKVSTDVVQQVEGCIGFVDNPPSNCFVLIASTPCHKFGSSTIFVNHPSDS